MGSGFRTFATSEVLTGSNVQNYLMEQTVMSFASTGARDAALTSPETGMVAYVRSNDANEGFHTYSSASTWRKGPGWNAPWGFIQYAESTSNVSVKNGNILTSNISVVNNRRYRITGQCNAFVSTSTNDVSGFSIVVGGTTIQAINVGAVSGIIGGFGPQVIAYYTATTTNASLSCNLYNNAVTGVGTHTFQASATAPLFIAVEDIGPSGAPA
jgi:hypothetical protein